MTKNVSLVTLSCVFSEAIKTQHSALTECLHNVFSPWSFRPALGPYIALSRPKSPKIAFSRLK